MLTADPGNYQMADYRSSDVMTRCLMLSSRAAISQEQVYALFDIIPGMDYCELQRDAYGLSKGRSSKCLTLTPDPPAPPTPTACASGGKLVQYQTVDWGSHYCHYGVIRLPSQSAVPCFTCHRVTSAMFCMTA